MDNNKLKRETTFLVRLLRQQGLFRRRGARVRRRARRGVRPGDQERLLRSLLPRTFDPVWLPRHPHARYTRSRRRTIDGRPKIESRQRSDSHHHQPVGWKLPPEHHCVQWKHHLVEAAKLGCRRPCPSLYKRDSGSGFRVPWHHRSRLEKCFRSDWSCCAGYRAWSQSRFVRSFTRKCFDNNCPHHRRPLGPMQSKYSKENCSDHSQSKSISANSHFHSWRRFRHQHGSAGRNQSPHTGWRCPKLQGRFPCGFPGFGPPFAFKRRHPEERPLQLRGQRVPQEHADKKQIQVLPPGQRRCCGGKIRPGISTPSHH